MDNRRVEERVIEYVAIDKTGREMLVPHITPELAAKWVAEEGVHIVTRERRRLVPVFGSLQTVLPEPESVELPVLAISAESKLGQELGLPPGIVGFL